MKTDLLSLTPEELVALLATLGEPAYRAGQIFTWLHRGATISEMTNLSKPLREKLAEVAFARFPVVEQKQVSALDGTIKYLFSLADGEAVESVVMRYKHGNTICISSQVGCRMGCKFCASTLGGLVRDLTAGELLSQVIAAEKDMGERISNIVMMGIGEPLDNYDNVIRFLKLVNLPGGLNIGYRHISLSTCGLVDGIRRLAEEDLPITLSISLHAPDNDVRDRLMPVNRRYPVEELLVACRDYFAKTGRRISFEYTLIAGENDSAAQAAHLADVLHRYLPRSMPIHVNLILLNPVAERSFVQSSRADGFCRALGERHINATIRRRLGPDIDAACGQLRRKNQKKDN